MGEVYVAEDTRLERRVALKLLRPEIADSPDRRARFQWEARAAAALNHPNIVHLYSVEESDGLLFITMELVQGTEPARAAGCRRAAAASADALLCVSDGRGPCVRPCCGHPAPGSEARQPHDHRRRSRQDSRLRIGKAVRAGLGTGSGGGDGCGRSDTHGNDLWYGGLHVARTGAWQDARPALRSLRSGSCASTKWRPGGLPSTATHWPRCSISC